MSNRLFQGIVHQMKDAIDRTIGVIDETSVVIACSELGKIGEVNESINSETLSSTAPFVINGYTYKSFGSSAKYDYAVFVQGTDEYAQKYAQLLSVSFSSIKQYYDEKYDRSNFIKNVILDNILPGDIYLKARELHFNSDVSRVCLLIKIISKTDVSAYDIVQNLSSSTSTKRKSRLSRRLSPTPKAVTSRSSPAPSRTPFRANFIRIASSASAPPLQASRISRVPSRRRSPLWRSQRCSTQSAPLSATIISASPV